jgi:hypothetical protein
MFAAIARKLEEELHNDKDWKNVADNILKM